MSTLSRIRMLLRITFVIQLLLGIVIWINTSKLVLIHILLGICFVGLLWTVAFLTARKQASVPLVVVAVVWGFFAIVFGLRQSSFVPGSAHVVIQILHILIGVGALGLAEMLVASTKKKLSNSATV